MQLWYSFYFLLELYKLELNIIILIFGQVQPKRSISPPYPWIPLHVLLVVVWLLDKPFYGLNCPKYYGGPTEASPKGILCFSVSPFHCFSVSLLLIFHFSISLLLFFTVFLFLLNGPQFLFHCFHVSHFHFAVSLFFCFSVSLANCFSFHWFSVSLFRCFSLIYCLTVCLFLWSNVALFHWFSVSLFLFHWFTVSECISENRGWWIPVRQLRQIDGNATGRQETGLPYHDKITKTRKQQTKNISALTFLYFAKGRIVILRRRTQFINFDNGFELSGVKNDWGLYLILLTLLQNLAIRKAWPIYHNAKLNVASVKS